ncbi:MAG: aryl-sulfate sulfotransferase [Candidatus Hodarchaeota archaeon]
MKPKRKILMFVLILELAAFPIFTMVIPKLQPMGMPLDIDYITEGPFAGNFLVSDNGGQVLIVNSDLEVLWRSEIPEVFVHEAEILPSGNIIVADTGAGTVLEININNPSDVVWQWDPRNIDDIDWLVFGNSVGWSQEALDYVGNPDLISDWTHINDAEWINGSTRGRSYDSILISMRNFDLIIEINYTDTKEVIWHYGEPLNYEILYHQHNVDIRTNWNVIICDSENHRIIEIDYETKEIVWEFALEFPEGELRWARDCDDLGNGTYLITDSNNGRVILIDRETKEIIWDYGKDYLIMPYEADLIIYEGRERILVGDSPATGIVLINPVDGSMEFFGFAWIAWYMRFTAGLIVFYYGLMFAVAYRGSGEGDLKSKLRNPTVYRELIHILFSFCVMWFVGSFYRYLIEFGLFPVMDGIAGLSAS